MYLVICFLYSFGIVLIPVILYPFGKLIWSIIGYGTLSLAWLLAPACGYIKAREFFFNNKQNKGKKLPPKVKKSVIATCVTGTVLGYALLIIFFINHY